MYAHIITVFLLVAFILVTTKTIVYKRNPKNGKYELSYRSLIIVSSIATGIWYACYLFFSTNRSDITQSADISLDEDIFE